MSHLPTTTRNAFINSSSASAFSRYPFAPARNPLRSTSGGFVKRKQDDFHFGMLFSNNAGGFQTIHARHGHIHQNNFRTELIGKLDRVAAIAGFAAHFPFRKRLQDRFDAPPDEGMVIDNQDSRHEANLHEPLREVAHVPTKPYVRFRFCLLNGQPGFSMAEILRLNNLVFDGVAH